MGGLMVQHNPQPLWKGRRSSRISAWTRYGGGFMTPTEMRQARRRILADLRASCCTFRTWPWQPLLSPAGSEFLQTSQATLTTMVTSQPLRLKSPHGPPRQAESETGHGPGFTSGMC
jgi:hypothetical protein